MDKALTGLTSRQRASLLRNVGYSVADQLLKGKTPCAIAAMRPPPAPPARMSNLRVRDQWGPALIAAAAWTQLELGDQLPAGLFPLPKPVTDVPDLWPYLCLRRAVDQVRCWVA